MSVIRTRARAAGAATVGVLLAVVLAVVVAAAVIVAARAMRRSGSQPAAANAASDERPSEPPVCPSGMVPIDGGTLVGGEEPATEVADFCLDRTEVTVEEYARCLGHGCQPALTTGYVLGDGSRCNAGDPAASRHPVNCVGFDQAERFCRFVGKRLPSRSEWAWAAWGGARRSVYPWGDDEAPSRKRTCWNRAEAGSCPVGTYRAEAFGLLDMSANVSEWVTAGPGKSSGDPDTHPVMGADFSSTDPWFMRAQTSARLSSMAVTSRSGETIGFRCAAARVPGKSSAAPRNNTAPPSDAATKAHAQPPALNRTVAHVLPSGIACPPNMNAIAGGSFEFDNEKVTAVAGFCMDVTQVTAEAYERCVGAHACPPRSQAAACNGADRPNHPANCTSFREAEAYCSYAGKRLPSAAQWQYADRGGPQGYTYSWGEAEPSAQLACIGRDRKAGTCTVGAFAPGAYGLRDMGGNVQEWLTDVPPAPDDQEKTNGSCSQGHFASSHIVRWIDDCALDEQNETVGFRCVLQPGMPAAVDAGSGAGERKEAEAQPVDPCDLGPSAADAAPVKHAPLTFRELPSETRKRFEGRPWKIESQVWGDLNADGNADVAVVVIPTDRNDNDNENGNGETDSTPRALVVLLKVPEGYRAVGVGRRALLCPECGGLSGASIDLAIERGELTVSWMYGAREMSSDALVFRYDTKLDGVLLARAHFEMMDQLIGAQVYADCRDYVRQERVVSERDSSGRWSTLRHKIPPLMRYLERVDLGEF
jgi:formylglycine-generating enzyme required for sulfatase activity